MFPFSNSVWKPCELLCLYIESVACFKDFLLQPRGSPLPEKQVVEWKPISEQRVLAAFHLFDKCFNKKEIIVLLVHCETNLPACCYKELSGSQVYWTVHRLDSWIKIDQLDVTCFINSLFTAQHVSNVSTSIFRSLRLIVDLFHVLYCSGSIRVGVTVWFGWGGVVSLCRLQPA
jgi:hypothetical protein